MSLFAWWLVTVGVLLSAVLVAAVDRLPHDWRCRAFGHVWGHRTANEWARGVGGACCRCRAPKPGEEPAQ